MHYWLLGLALFSLSTSPIFTRLAQAPIEVVCFWRLLLAGSILQIYQWILPRQKPTSTPADVHEISKSKRWAFITGFFFFVHLWTFVFAVQHASVAHLVILFSANPIFTAVISRYWLQDAHMAPSLKQRIWASYPLALLGILVLMNGGTSNHESQLSGDLVTLVSAFLHSFYLLASRQARAALPNLQVSRTIYLVGSSFFLITSFIAGVDLIHYPTSTWIAIATLVALPSLMGHTLFTYLVSAFPVSVLSVSKLIEPALSMVLAAVVLGETVSPQTLVAFAITSVALSLLYWPEWLWNQLRAVFRLPFSSK